MCNLLRAIFQQKIKLSACIYLLECCHYIVVSKVLTKELVEGVATGLRAHPPHKGGRMEPELQVLSEGHVPAVHTHRNKGCGLVNEKWVTN